MNYIISSIVLLVVIMIIIYLLSIDNNMEKFKNKLRDTFVTIKSKELNYINQQDSMNLLYFLKSYYPQYNNIMIPKKIFYTKIEDTDYIMSDINIIGYKLENNIYLNTEHTVNIKFIPIKNELFIGRYTLFGINGNYYIEKDSNDIIKNPDPIIVSEKINTKKHIKSILKSDITHSVTDVLDLIPDIIHLSSNIEDDSVNVTTESEQNNTYRGRKSLNNIR
jgi:hypothetical protein